MSYFKLSSAMEQAVGNQVSDRAKTFGPQMTQINIDRNYRDAALYRFR